MLISTKKTYLENIIYALNGKKIHEKNEILNVDSSVQEHFEQFTMVKNEKKKYLLKCLIVIGGVQILVNAIKNKCIDLLLHDLEQIDDFFLQIGGIIGYQHQVLSLLEDDLNYAENLSIHSPCLVNISKDNSEVSGYIKKGIENLDQMGEIYVVGGAADRLHMVDEKTKKRLPAAMMNFFSKTLMQRLIEDVAAKEYLFEKLTGKKVFTPIAMMCSSEHNNYNRIKQLFEDNNYFNRPKDSFFFLVQPSVPVVSKDGKWIEKKGRLLLKPSGHGALWKLAKDKKLFEWFFKRNRKKALVRQINNPIAGVDFGLLAFTGYGLVHDFYFGFASCPRQIHSAEGMNVVIEKKKNKHYEYAITNIEYCEFEKFKIKDSPIKKNGQFSKFSSNTNLLFIDLKQVQEKCDQFPYPGMLINYKPLKECKGMLAGRLETTMQNIADVFTETFEAPLKPPYALSKTFVSYSERNKTISTTKRAYDPLKGFLETPEKCFYDFAINNYDLLKNYCEMNVPEVLCFESFVSAAPPFLFSYHPALGPIYKIISQKIKRGRLSNNSELVVDIADFFCENLQLDGSLRIFSSDLSCKCIFKNISVKNAGVDFASTKNFWKGNYSHIEKCDIYLGKKATLIASDLTISKENSIIIPDGQTIEIVNGENGIELREVENIYDISYKFLENSSVEVAAEKNIFSQPQIFI